MMKYPNLFSPLKVNGMMLRNRILAAPMGIIASHKLISSTNYGAMSAWDRSMGGSALVHIPAEGIDIFSKYELDVTKEQINTAKQDGAKVACEVGFFSMTPDEEGFVYGPMDGMRFDGVKMKAFTHEKMASQIHEMSTFCVKCKNIGFDAVTLHFGHDSLGSQFLSPVWNKRHDEYGGSLENRSRFLKEALMAVRQAVGPDYPIILRISRQLIVPETYSEEDMLQFLLSVEDLVDMANVSCGMDVVHAANVHAVPTIFEPHAYNQEFAKKLKMRSKLLVCLVGAVMNAKEAEALICDGAADCCMFGRSLIADPYWPKKALYGYDEDIVPCIRCMQCYHIASDHWNVQCSVNPRFRRENRLTLQTPLPFMHKRVVIIGGGPAGMNAALAASKKGHEVILIEKEKQLGGLLVWAAKGPFKEDLYLYLTHLIKQIEKSTVTVMLDTFANPQLVKQLKPDSLILALGSDSKQLPIAGQEKMLDCLTAIDNMSALGNEIVIVGGGSIGCELALELSLLNKKVNIIEMTGTLASNGNMLYRTALLQHLEKATNIEIYMNCRCQSITDHDVLIKDGKGERVISFDTIINASGRVSKTSAAESFYGITPETSVIGDCERVGAIVDAVNIAYFAGHNL